MAASLIASAQTWTKTSAPSNSWTCIASSANGSNLIAGTSSGPLYLSTNSGTTWTVTIATNEYWTSVASSADGTHLFASASYDSSSGPAGLYISTNSGAAWMTINLPDLYWGSVASSADGQTLVAVAPGGAGGGGPGGIFSTTNGGISWTTNNINEEFGVASSADGKKMFAVGGETYRSTNSGITWARETNAPFILSLVSPSQYIAASVDGTKLILCIPWDGSNNPGPIYVSTDSGDTWSRTSAPSNDWGFVTSSADGNTIVAVPYSYQSGTICLSTNGGETWTTNSPIENWGAIACSADGGKLAAAAFELSINGGPIYTSQSIVSPLMDVASANGGVKLSWIVPSTNFVLLQSPDLSNWSNVTNIPVLKTNDVQDYVTVVSTNRLRFYRLKLQ